MSSIPGYSQLPGTARRAPDSGAGGWPGLAPAVSIIAVGGILAIHGTSSAHPTKVWEHWVIATASNASSPAWHQGVSPCSSVMRSVDTQRVIAELRRLSGLTWEQLAQLFAVSPRTIHFWASGRAPSVANEQRLLRVRDVVRDAYRGDSKATRAALFTAVDGTTPFECLTAQQFDEARALLGPTTDHRGRPLHELSAAARAARHPLPPEDLVGALHDPVHREAGRGRPARTVRSQRHERSG